MVQCLVCGSRTPRNVTIEGICPGCYARLELSQCRRCGRVGRKVGFHGDVCYRCARNCEVCGEPAERRNPLPLTEFSRKVELCRKCKDNARKILADRRELAEILWKADQPKLANEILSDDERTPSLSQEVPGMLSYAKQPEHAFSNRRRIRIKPGRFFRKVLKCDLDDKSLKDLVNRIVGESEGIGEPMIFRGRELMKAYQMFYTGGLTSCMTGNDADKMQLLADNPDKVAVALFGESDPIARVLLWNCEGGLKAYDRVYADRLSSAEEKYKEAVKCWAEENGYVSAYNTNSRFEVELKADLEGLFPYLDSFCYVIGDSHDTVVLTNDPGHPDGIHSFKLRDTQGNVVYVCEACEEEEPAEYGEHGNESYLCRSCEDMVECENCGRRTDDPLRVCLRNPSEEVWCPSCVDSYAFECEHCTDRYEYRVSVEVLDEDGNDFLACERCAERYSFECYECGSRFVREMAIDCDDGTYCRSCFEKLAKRCEKCGEPHMDDGVLCYD